MKNVKYYLETLNRDKLIKNFIYQHNLDDRYAKLKEEPVLQFSKKFTQEIDEFINNCVNNLTPAEINPIDREIVFGYSINKNNPDILLLHEKEVLKFQLHAPKYKISGLEIERILSLLIADTPYTLNNIYPIIAEILFEMWKLTPQYKEYDELEHKIYSAKKFEAINTPDNPVPEKTDMQKQELKKKIWNAKTEYKAYCCNTEIAKVFTLLTTKPPKLNSLNL